MQYKNEKVTEAQIDKGNYNGSEIVILKIPVSLPYLPPVPREERIYGQVRIDGKWYSKVSRRMINDTYFIKCVRDRSGETLTAHLHDFISFIFDNTPDHQSNRLALSLLLKDFLPLTHFASLQYISSPETVYSPLRVHLPADLFADMDTPPPRFS